jgi:uncharacterized membrane protein
MSAPPGPTHEDRLSPNANQRMTLVLRAGLLLAVAILLGALLAYLVTYPNATSEAILAANPILGYLSPGGLVRGLAAGHREAFLTLGLLVLLATPILRVATGAYYFYRDGEREMAAITTTVFVLLLVGLFLIGPYVP